jgi:hypothetical protein
MGKRFAKTDKRNARGYNAATVKSRAIAREVRDLEAELHRRGYTDEDIRRAIKEMKG